MDNEINKNDSANDSEQKTSSKVVTSLPESRTKAEARIELFTRVTKTISPRLRSHLGGSTLLKLTDKGEQYLFHWAGSDDVAVKQLDASIQELSPVECTISMDEEIFNQLRLGTLNPQIAMLTSKVSVTGSAGAAVYFFNIFSKGEVE